MLGDDDWGTPKTAWQAISKYIPKKLIWEPFYLDGKSGKYLEELGFDVIHEDLDFFTHDFGEIVVSNPPFSRKRAIVKRLVDMKKPFILLMPAAVLTTEYIRCVPDLQIIVPAKRIHFVKEGEQTSRCSFGCLYFCSRMGLERNITFLD